MSKTRAQRLAGQRHIEKGVQAVLPGEIEPGVCVHPISNKEFGGGTRTRPSHMPCDACLWCFKNEAWEGRACFKAGVCPLKERKRVSTWGKAYELWLIRARRKIMLARLTAQRAKRRSTGSAPSQMPPGT